MVATRALRTTGAGFARQPVGSVQESDRALARGTSVQCPANPATTAGNRLPRWTDHRQYLRAPRSVAEIEGVLEAHLRQRRIMESSPLFAWNKIEENNTIDKNFVRRIRTKKTSTFRPSELNGNQIAADKNPVTLQTLCAIDSCMLSNLRILRCLTSHWYRGGT